MFTRKNSFGRVLDFVRDVEKIIMKMNDRKGNVEREKRRTVMREEFPWQLFSFQHLFLSSVSYLNLNHENNKLLMRKIMKERRTRL